MELKLANYKSYLLFAAVIVLILFSYKLVVPFIPALLTAVILAIIFNPLFTRILRIVKQKQVSAGITLFLIFLIVAIPLLFMTGPVIRETTALQEGFNKLDFSKVSETINSVTKINININTYAKDYASKISGFLINATANIFVSIMKGLLSIIIIAFTMFYLFIQGPELIKKLKKTIPLARHKKDKLFKDVQNTTNGIIFGLVVSGLAQGVVGALGFYFLGIPNAILWGIIITILAILPAIGASAIWFPTVIYLFAMDRIVAGIILFLYGFLIISSIENILKPKLIGVKANIHPIVIFLGLLGGLKLFGFAGILIGPLILSLLVVLYRALEEENVT